MGTGIELMADAAPLAFASQDLTSDEKPGPLAIAEVVLHRAFETDKDGRTTIHVWVTARVTPPDEDYVSLTADIDFALSYDDAEIGRCSHRGLVLTHEDREPREIEADGELRLPLNAEVTHISVEVDLTKVVHVQGKQRYGLATKST